MQVFFFCQELAAEILVLRQQLAVLNRKIHRPQLQLRVYMQYWWEIAIACTVVIGKPRVSFFVNV
jgi:hypothetical protein